GRRAPHVGRGIAAQDADQDRAAVAVLPGGRGRGLLLAPGLPFALDPVPALARDRVLGPAFDRAVGGPPPRPPPRPRPRGGGRGAGRGGGGPARSGAPTRWARWPTPRRRGRPGPAAGPPTAGGPGRAARGRDPGWRASGPRTRGAAPWARPWPERRARARW